MHTLQLQQLLLAPRMKRRNKKYAYYVCKNSCGGASIAGQKLNDSLIEYLHNITPSKEQLEAFLMVPRKKFTQNVNAIKTNGRELSKKSYS